MTCCSTLLPYIFYHLKYSYARIIKFLTIVYKIHMESGKHAPYLDSMDFVEYNRHKIPDDSKPVQASEMRYGATLSMSTAICPRLIASSGLNVPSWKPLIKPPAAILVMAPYDHRRDGSVSLKPGS